VVADVFLEKCHVSKMISKYIVLHESDKILMILRPYQYYAVETIDARVTKCLLSMHIKLELFSSFRNIKYEISWALDK